MSRLISALIFVLASAGASVAQSENTSELKPLVTGYDVQGWEAVGRLNIGRGGMCTGALIGPRLVLTAAHCLYDQATGMRVSPTEITFLAGWRNGRASATRQVRRAVAHPDYEYTGPTGTSSIAYDVALLELASDIRLSSIQPFETASRPRKGASVGVVSYAHDRAETLSLQEACHVLARQRGALVLSCEVDFGSSGAPIFADIDGKPRIVSVVSAKAMVQGRRVSLGTNLEGPLEELREMLANGQGTAVNVSSGAKRLSVGSGLGSGKGGAKFVKP